MPRPVLLVETTSLLNDLRTQKVFPTVGEFAHHQCLSLALLERERDVNKRLEARRRWLDQGMTTALSAHLRVSDLQPTTDTAAQCRASLL